MVLIEFEHVSKVYDSGGNAVKAVDGISLTVEQGEFAVICGPSGAGKTTLLNLIGGMDYVTSGDIKVNGKSITGLNDDGLTRYRAENIGFVFQFYNLIPTLTAEENISLVKNIIKRPVNAKELLSFMGLSHVSGHFPAQLSGGEQQRVSIARALAKDSGILLCDEPTGALDTETGVTVLELLRRMSREKGKTVIIVSHNSSLCEAADKVIKIKNGRVTDIIKNAAPKAVREVMF